MKSNFKKALLFIIMTVLVATVFTACSTWSGNTYPGNMSAKFTELNKEDEVPFNLKAGDTVTFTYESKLDKGTLSIKIMDPDGGLVKELPVNDKGTEEIRAEKDGSHKVVIAGSEADGSYSVKWKIKK